MSDIIEKLVAAFLHFPGIGPRQARRFVYYLLTRNSTVVENLARDLLELKQQINQCRNCYRFFPNAQPKTVTVCDVCRDQTRQQNILLIVEKDVDLETVRKSGHYPGQFFVLGGLLPILEKNPERKIRIKELFQHLNARPVPFQEIIIALAVNPAGDNTGDYLQKVLAAKVGAQTKISVLGRGLSTGTELEYSDDETIRNALKNRA